MQFIPDKKFGFGLMRLPVTNPSDKATVDLPQMKAMVDLFMERGFTYFDTAWMYNGFASETAVREALIERYPRDSFTLATKLHAEFVKTKEDRDRIFEAQLEKTGAGYFDYYLLHAIDENKIGKYEAMDCFRWLQSKKEAGLVRHIGFSFHGTPALLEKVLTEHPEMEFVQLQLNYLDWTSPWVCAGQCYEICEKHGKPVIVMEPVKGGTLAAIPAEAEALFRAADPAASPAVWAIRFAASLPNVMVVLSGMSTLQQMEENSAMMENFAPLTARERNLCERAAEIINAQIAVPCTGCEYCLEGCPMHIAIPQYFSMYNEDCREDLSQKGWTVNLSNYKQVAESFGKASACIACGQCESVCPQHLPIIEHLRAVAEHFE